MIEKIAEVIVAFCLVFGAPVVLGVMQVLF